MSCSVLARFGSFAAAVLLAGLLASEISAQGSARSLDLDPSVRSAGMALASNAVFWDEGPNHWGNPALLGYQRGLRYEWGKTRLVPGLAPNVFFRTNVVKLGGGGFAVALSGKPLEAIGGLRLDYGRSEGTDDQGNPTGSFDSWEDINSWSLGLSLARAGESVARLYGRDPKVWSRYGDISFGMSGKHVDIQLAPASMWGTAETSAHDVGVLVRVSPLDWFDATRGGWVGVDLAYGWSKLSYDGEDVVFLNEDQGTPPSEHVRNGVAARLRLDWPDAREFLPDPEWLWQGFRPLVAVGVALDDSHVGPGSGYETDSKGLEVAVANLFSWRIGHYEDRLGEIVDDTWGWSVGLPIGGLAGVRYDHGRFPQARDSDLEDLRRHAVSAWLDPLAIWSMLRSDASRGEARRQPSDAASAAVAASR